MVRVPLSYLRAGITRHAMALQAASPQVRRIPSTPVHAYDQLVTVDLGNDGVAPTGYFSGYSTTTGSVTSPTAFDFILFANNVPPGTYTIPWSVSLSGTLSSADTNNFQLVVSGTTFVASVNPDTAGTYPQTPVTATVTAANPTIGIRSIGAGTSGAVYGATLTSSAAALTTFVGPSGLGVSWGLDQCYVSTSVGQLDTSHAIVYVGPTITSQNAVTGSVQGGSSQFGLGGLGLSNGWFVWCTWTGGTPGAQAYLRVTGSKTAQTGPLGT
jgi:hypothetical protein